MSKHKCMCTCKFTIIQSCTCDFYLQMFIKKFKRSHKSSTKTYTRNHTYRYRGLLDRWAEQQKHTHTHTQTRSATVFSVDSGTSNVKPVRRSFFFRSHAALSLIDRSVRLMSVREVCQHTPLKTQQLPLLPAASTLCVSDVGKAAKLAKRALGQSVTTAN